MLLSIVLIIFTLVLSVISVGLFVWWRKYGKELFVMLKKMNNNQKSSFSSMDTTLLNEQMNFLRNFLEKK